MESKVWIKLEQSDLDKIARTVTEEVRDCIISSGLNNDFLPSVYDLNGMDETYDQDLEEHTVIIPLKRKVKKWNEAIS